MAEIKNRIIGSGIEPLDSILFNPRNWRIHPLSQQDALKGVLEEVGWVQQVIVNKRTGNLIDGHLRCQLAAREGATTIPVVYVDVSEDEEALVLATLDPIAAMAATDKQKLDDLFASIETENADVLKMLDDIAEKERLEYAKRDPVDAEPQIDRAEELREKWGVESGQLWQLGEHRLICGDCTDRAVVEKVMQGERAELLFTSPPYADMRTYEGDKDLSIEKLIEFIPAFRDFVNYQVINLGLKRDAGEVVQYWDLYIAKAKNSGYKFLSWNVWNREHATTIGLQSAFFPIFHEWIFVFGVDTKEINKTQPKSEASYERQKYAKPGTRRGKDGVLRPGDKGDTSSDFVKIGTVTTLKAANTIANSLHPAMFPVELPEEYIKAMTSDSDIVCEPFSGSGTTMVACENLHRKCRAIEISPNYCAVILERMATAFPELEIKRLA